MWAQGAPGWCWRTCWFLTARSSWPGRVWLGWDRGRLRQALGQCRPLLSRARLGEGNKRRGLWWALLSSLCPTELPPFPGGGCSGTAWGCPHRRLSSLPTSGAMEAGGAGAALWDGGQSPGTGRRPQQLLSPVAGARTVRARPAAALSTAEGRRGVVRLCLRGTGSHSGGLSCSGSPGQRAAGPCGRWLLGREPHAEPWGAELWGWAGLGARPPLRRPYVPGVAAARLTPCPSVLPLPSLFLSRR